MFIIFFTFALVASSIFVNKLLLQILSPTLFIGIRMLVSGLILFAFTWRKYKTHLYQVKEDWLLLSWIALFTVLIPGLLKAYALTRLEAAQATLLGAFEPFVTAFYAYLLLGERLSWTKVVGMVIGFTGVLLSINLSQVDLHITSLNILWPQLAVLAAVAFSRWGWLVIQIQLRKNRYPPAQLNSIVMMESGFLSLLLFHWVEPWKDISIPSIPRFAFLLIYTIMVGNVIAYTLYGHLLKEHSATLISLASFSMPIFVGIYSWLLLGQAITIRFIVAAAILFLGLVIFYKDDLKKARAVLPSQVTQ